MSELGCCSKLPGKARRFESYRFHQITTIEGFGAAVTPIELRNLGTKHGRGWQIRLARALPADPRTVRRWLTGQTTMHPAIAKQVRSIISGWAC